MSTADDNRDDSPAGERRRRYFGRMLDVLADRGLPPGEARRELLSARRGQMSERLRALLARQAGRRAD